MRDCANVEVRDLLPELLHERLAERDREHVLAHVASCVDCSAELSLLRVTAAVSTADGPRVDATRVAQQVLARLYAAPSRGIAPAARRPAWGRGTLRAAAAALIMIAGSGIVLYERGTGGASSPAAIEGTGAQTVAPSGAVAASPAPPAVVAETVSRAPTRAPARPAAQSALGASFGDLSDDELAAVLTAIEATDRGPAADPPPTPTIVTSGETL